MRIQVNHSMVKQVYDKFSRTILTKAGVTEQELKTAAQEILPLITIPPQEAHNDTHRQHTSG